MVPYPSSTSNHDCLQMLDQFDVLQTKSFFQSCMDLSTIEVFGAQPFYDLINSLGGWGALQPWNESMWDFNLSLYTCQGRLSISVFFSISVGPNPFQPRNNVLIVSHN